MLTAALVGGAFAVQRGGKTNSIPSRVATVHKTPTCGCCTNYITYLKRQGFDVQVENHDNLSDIKDQYHVPNRMESCHTTVVDGYVSEGHIPAESILKMIEEKPLIAGIALPGMPAGSPGMGGVQFGSFSIFGFTEDGQTEMYDAQ